MQFVLFFLLFYGAFMLSAQNTYRLDGQITNPTDSVVRIKYYPDHIFFLREVEYRAPVASDGTFSLTVPVDRARMARFYHGNEFTNIFLEPDVHLRITLDANNFDSTVKYSGTPPTALQNHRYLAWEMLNFSPMKVNGKTARLSASAFLAWRDSMQTAQINDFIGFWDMQQPFSDNFREIKSGEIFYNAGYDLLRYEMLTKYFNNRRDSVIVMPADYYERVLSKYCKYTETLAGNSLAYQYFWDEVIKQKTNEQKNWALGNYYRHASALGQPLTRKYAQMAVVRTGLRHNYDSADSVYQVFVKEHSDYLPVLDTVYATFKKLAKGSSAPDFSLKDLDGKSVSLKDFRGKVVYMDIWASWCQPCLWQFPHLPKVKESLSKKELKDIVFLYVNVNTTEEAWREAVKTHQLSGVHLFCAGTNNNPVMQAYGTSGIPHYALIDRKGNLISNSPPRPSQPEKLVKALKEAVKK
jgi:thiol-disulfide isomerase/thioredoxin